MDVVSSAGDYCGGRNGRKTAMEAATPARNWSGLGAREGEGTEGKRGGGRGVFVGQGMEGDRGLTAGNREGILPVSGRVILARG